MTRLTTPTGLASLRQPEPETIINPFVVRPNRDIVGGFTGEISPREQYELDARSIIDSPHMTGDQKGRALYALGAQSGFGPELQPQQHLVDRYRAEVARKTAATREEIKRQTAIATKEYETGLKFLGEGATIEQVQRLWAQIISRRPLAGWGLPDPFGYDIMEEARENESLRDAEIMRHYSAALNGDDEAAGRVVTLLGMKYPDKPEVVYKFQDQIMQERRYRSSSTENDVRRQVDILERSAQFTIDEVVAGGSVSDESYIPFYGGPEQVAPRTFGVDDKNPYKEGSKPYQDFIRGQNEARNTLNQRILDLLRATYGGAQSTRPESVAAAQTAQAERPDTPSPTSPPAAPNALTVEQAQSAFATGQLPPGVPFTGTDGNRYRFSAVTRRIEPVE